MKNGGRCQNRLFRPALQPGEQGLVGRLQAVPERFDIGDIFAAHFGQRLLGKPCGHADAQRACCQLQKGEAAGMIEMIQQIAHRSAHLGTAKAVHAVNDLAKTRLFSIAHMLFGTAIPNQRNRLSQIAHIIVGILKENGIEFFQRQLLQQSGLDGFRSSVPARAASP